MATCLGGTPLSDKRLNEIFSVAKDWCLSNGVGLRSGSEPGVTKAMAAPFSLFPSVMPSSLLDLAKSTMPHFNRLMHKVALDHEFLVESFKNVIEVDDFMKGIWNIYLKVREHGVKQPILLGLYRNDFMINHVGQGDAADVFQVENGQVKVNAENLQLRQIEFNTIASGMPGLGQKMSDMHRLTLGMAGKEFTSKEVPENTPASDFGVGFVRAWELYGNPNAVIIFVVSEMEKNFLDQRAMELKIYEKNPKVRVLRKTILDIYETGSLDKDSNLIVDGDEVAILYFRDGYTAPNYPSHKEWDARLTMELSRAIKCPSIQYQLVGAKKIQQELARPGALERYIDDPEVVKALRSTFADQYSLDLGPEGDEAVILAKNSPMKFVLKPQREGGGNNLYGDDIVSFLNEHANSKERNAYVLMERIYPLQQKNYLYKAGVPVQLSDVVSELGIFGLYIGTTDYQELENWECHQLLRTKISGTTEGGIYAGSAVLDSLYVV